MAAAELSYQGALWYAKERLAMRSLTGPKNTEGPADPIICHPDVRKMLLTQRCIAEAGRSMVYECALLNDLMMEADATGDEKEVKRIEGELHFLTPILKGFLTEMGVEAANLGIQIYGKWNQPSIIVEVEWSTHISCIFFFTFLSQVGMVTLNQTSKNKYYAMFVLPPCGKVPLAFKHWICWGAKS